MVNYLKLMRVKHWIKNFLVFLPLLFGQSIFDLNKLLSTFLSFISFSLVASIVYIVNDLKDIEKDRIHKTKCKRPLASGKISKQHAVYLAVFLFFISIVLLKFATNYFINALCIMLLYLLLNIWYSFKAKNIPILDIVILASGFLIRVFFGGIVANIRISNWLYLTIMAISFFFALGKRRNELISSTTNTREVLKHYDVDFLDKFMYLCLTLAIIFYALWTVDNEISIKFGNNLVYTIPIIIIICMKYTLIIEKNAKCNEEGDPTEVLLSDKLLLGLVLFYGLIALAIIYIL